MEFNEMYCLRCWKTLKMSDGVWYKDEFLCSSCYKIEKELEGK